MRWHSHGLLDADDLGNIGQFSQELRKVMPGQLQLEIEARMVLIDR